ncbi:hypothetical protein UFOVP595_26 [uncultured Caudovirales phage]|jgi:hypothetical protein|uniref:Uncharacterized protein n=1 Tax=uncultured Caudovirales phage TaxID=2100421 RepID=A0A6J5N7K2_9CAUD|nr:hypothetical protein UFOVP595_26 [uncultured Caudovirales phage]
MTNSINSMRIENLKKSINGVIFTPAQKKIVNKFIDGYTIVVINRHHANGGTWMFKNPNSENIEHAGKVYKAFWGVFNAIQKQNKIFVNPNSFIVA